MIALELFASEAGARPPAAGKEVELAPPPAEAFAALLAILTAPPPSGPEIAKGGQSPLPAEQAAEPAMTADPAPSAATDAEVLETKVAESQSGAPARPSPFPADPRFAGPAVPGGETETKPWLRAPDAPPPGATEPTSPLATVARALPAAGNRHDPDAAARPEAASPPDGEPSTRTANGLPPVPARADSSASPPPRSAEPEALVARYPTPDTAGESARAEAVRAATVAVARAAPKPPAGATDEPEAAADSPRAAKPSSLVAEPRSLVAEPGSFVAEPGSFVAESLESRPAPASPPSDPTETQDAPSDPEPLAAGVRAERPAPLAAVPVPPSAERAAGATSDGKSIPQPLALRPPAASPAGPPADDAAEPAEPPALRLVLRPEADAAPALVERTPPVRPVVRSRSSSAEAPARFTVSEPPPGESAGSDDHAPVEGTPETPAVEPKPAATIPAPALERAAQADSAAEPMPPAPERPFIEPSPDAARPVARPPASKFEPGGASPLPETPALAAGNVHAPEPAPTVARPAERAAGEHANAAARPEEALAAEPSRIETARVERDAERTRFEMVVRDDRLGRVSVRLVERAGLIDLMVRAENPATARALRESLPVLVESLAQARLRAEPGEFAPGGERGGSPHDERERREQRREQPRRPRARAAAAFRVGEA